MPFKINNSYPGHWLILFPVVAMLTAVVLSLQFPITGEQDGWINSLVWAALGAGVGFLIFYLTHHADQRLRITALGVLLAGLIVSLWSVMSEQRVDPASRPEESPSAAKSSPVLKTCPVCGYQTLEEDNTLCKVCYVELSIAEMVNWEYRSMEEMIREEQAMFFADQGFRDSVSFYKPDTWEVEGTVYRKDSTWEPRVGKREVLSLRDTLIMEGIILQ